MNFDVLAGSFLAKSRTALWSLAILWALPHTPAAAHNTTTEIITLQYRTAEQVIPALQPLIPKPGTISGIQNRLIIRSTPANLAEMKRLLATLDAMPRQLLITVRQNAALDRDNAQTELASGRASESASSAITGSVHPGGGGAEVRGGNPVMSGRIASTRSLDSDRNTQSLQVLEGNSAFIRFGQSVPVYQQPLFPAAINGRWVERIPYPAEYRDVLTGFYVLPRLAGGRVTLEVSPWRDALSSPEQNLPPGSVNVQRIATTVSGRLGEWIELGAAAQGISNQQSVILGSTRETSTGNWRVLIKVEEVR